MHETKIIEIWREHPGEEELLRNLFAKLADEHGFVQTTPTSEVPGDRTFEITERGKEYRQQNAP